jgi:hypothetical protein
MLPWQTVIVTDLWILSMHSWSPSIMSALSHHSVNPGIQHITNDKTVKTPAGFLAGVFTA